MAGEDRNAILDALDEEMQSNWWTYRDSIKQAVETFSGNDGQMTIMNKYISPIALGHAQASKEEWPYGLGPEELQFELYEAYEPEVIERAFSGWIDDLTESITAYYEESQELQNEHDYVLGHSVVHSTNPPWTA